MQGLKEDSGCTGHRSAQAFAVAARKSEHDHPPTSASKRREYASILVGAYSKPFRVWYRSSLTVCFVAAKALFRFHEVHSACASLTGFGAFPFQVYKLRRK